MGDIDSNKAELDYKLSIGGENMKTRVILYAEEGMVLTNGEDYATEVYLGDADAPENYYEITVEEYKKLNPEVNEQVETGNQYDEERF